VRYSILIRKSLRICLALIFCLNLFGCATPAAHRFAKEKSSVPITYMEIVDVHPTAVRENGNIKICIKLRQTCLSGDCKEQHYLVSLPFYALASGKIKPEKKDLHKDVDSFDPQLPIYFFPIKKSSMECTEIAEKNVPPESQIRIERLYFQVGDWPGFYGGLPRNKEDFFAVLNKYNDVVPSKDALYSINIVHNESKPASILLTYFPDKSAESDAQAICIVGGYKDKSTKAGYALIPFAVIADVLIGVILFVGYLFSSGSGSLKFK